MMRRFSFALFPFLFLFLNLSAQSDLVITNVNVIPMNSNVVLKNKAVIIKKGKISSIIDAGAVREKNITVIDAKGAYMIPGLFDMHMHFYHDQGLDKKYLNEEIKLPLANGVTTVRIMNGNQDYLALKKSIADNKIPGPEMFVASPQFVGRWPFRTPLDGIMAKTGKEGEDAVKKCKVQGYDAIKLTMFLTPGVYDTIIRTAKDLGIKVTGHVGEYVRLPKALAAKQQIEHFDQFIETLLPDTSMNHGSSVSDYGIWDRRNAWPTVQYVDEAKIDELAQKVKNAGVYVTATNYFFTKYFGMGADKNEIEHFPNYGYVPAFMKKTADQSQAFYWNNPPPAELREKYIRIRYKVATALYNAGVKLMTGSDSPEWYLTPGFAVHDEIETFTKAGLSNFAALQTATINPAEYLGVLNRKGTIEPGKDADFVLLEKNPLDNIKNTRTINAVYTKGKFYDRKTLDQLLNDVKVIADVEEVQQN